MHIFFCIQISDIKKSGGDMYGVSIMPSVPKQSTFGTVGAYFETFLQQFYLKMQS